MADTTLVGLVGVAAGGLVTGSVQAVATRFDRRLEARASARIVYTTLHDAQKAVEDLRDRMYWLDMITDWPDYQRQWEPHSPMLARVLRTNRFQHVSTAFACLHSLALGSQKDEKEGGWEHNFSPTGEILDGYLWQIVQAKVVVLRASYTVKERLKDEHKAAIEVARTERPSQVEYRKLPPAE